MARTKGSFPVFKKMLQKESAAQNNKKNNDFVNKLS
jgi:hypothetical protein